MQNVMVVVKDNLSPGLVEGRDCLMEQDSAALVTISMLCGGCVGFSAACETKNVPWRLSRN